MSVNSKKLNERPYDDIHNINICEYDPLLSLYKNSRAPNCDCQKPMELHYYEPRVNIAKTAFRLIPKWYEERRKKGSKCDNCRNPVGEVLWVCPDKTCMINNMGVMDQVLLICTKCIGRNGIVTCALCEEDIRVDYSLPCTECKNPLCRKCHHSWTLKCPPSKERETSDITCPFCRSNIKKLDWGAPEKYYRTDDNADGQSSTKEEKKDERELKSGYVDNLLCALTQSMRALD